MNKRRFALAGWVLAGGASLAGAAACSNSFGTDCVATRTCPAAGGDGAVSTDEGGAPTDAGAPSATATDAGAPAVSSSAAGASGEAGGAASDNEPPVVTDVAPKRDAAEIEPDAVIAISFSEPLSPATVNDTSVELFDGDVRVLGTVSYAESQVTFKPDLPLGLLANYRVSVSVAVTDEEGAHLAEPFESRFSVREGKFSSQVVVKQPSFQLAEYLPLTARGDALLAWSDDSNGTRCPVLAKWFTGEGMDPEALTTVGASECEFVTAAANATGVAAVAWVVPDAMHGVYVKQYRDGAWVGGESKVSPYTASTRFRVAVAPNGVVTLFENGTPGSWAYRTDTSGKWAPPDTLSSNTTAISAPDVAFDAAGNALAIWRANSSANFEELLSSRYTVASGKWAPAKVVPGSLATNVTHQRGTPALAIDAKGDAVALWVKDDGAARVLMASRFSADQGWQDPTPVAPELEAQALYDTPGLVFDGQTFVAAFTASDGNALGAYTTRFDPEKAQWSEPELRSGPDQVVSRMPRLAGDPRGNLMLVWTTGGSPSFKLSYQRRVHGAWSATAEIPESAFINKYFAVSNYPMPLTMNAGGSAVMAWGSYDGDNHLAEIHLASFF